VAAACRRRPAFVLDGFPATAAQAAALAAEGLGPTSVCELALPAADARARAAAQLAARGADGRWARPRPAVAAPAAEGEAEGAADEGAAPREAAPGARALLCGEDAIESALAAQAAEAAGVRTALCEGAAARDVLDALDARAPRAAVHRAVRAALCEAAAGRQAMLAAAARGHAAPMAHQQRWFSRAELAAARGRLSRAGGDYCPVAWRDEGELRLCAPDRALRRMVRAGGALYVAADDAALAELRACAPYYTAPDAPGATPLPDELPARLPADEAAALPDSALACRGFCPVTLLDGPPPGEPVQKACRKPAPDAGAAARAWVCAYGGQRFRLLDAARQERFMRAPQRFAGATLPLKLPPDAAPVDLAVLPLPGYPPLLPPPPFVLVLPFPSCLVPPFPSCLATLVVECARPLLSLPPDPPAHPCTPPPAR